MKIVKVPLNKVVGWKDNPKSIKQEDMDRLIWQIKHLGVYKPLLVTRALKKDKVDADWIALGGNQRLKGFNELGFKEVHVSVVKADSQKKRIEYSLSDNDRVASYELDLLKMQMEPFLDDFDLDMFNIDLDDMMSNQGEEYLEEKQIEIRPYKKVHILLSIFPEKLIEIQDQLQIIKDNPSIEYEQSEN